MATLTEKEWASVPLFDNQISLPVTWEIGTQALIWWPNWQQHSTASCQSQQESGYFSIEENMVTKSVITSSTKKHHTCEQEFLTMSTSDLIDFCKSPPKDCEYNEMKTAAQIIALRYEDCMKNLNRF